ncbi:MAG: Acid phosphatase (EC [uncultured Caballeronia sp.]|nr:MAG: Acid phosphatase (EC [uncultured Caballeronia sp.]
MADRSVINGAVNVVPDFQTHHQPFNYFADLAPGTPNRAQHLRRRHERLGSTRARCRKSRSTSRRAI